MYQDNYHYLLSNMRRRAQAVAFIKGSDLYPNIEGIVRFFDTSLGTLIATEVYGLPPIASFCENSVFGFHIHENGDCSGNQSDFFANVGAHYNPNSCPHPLHAGDMPPLFDANGYAFSVFLTDRFNVDEIIGRSVIIHSKPDDFVTQPSGNSGEKIACGVIQDTKRNHIQA